MSLFLEYNQIIEDHGFDCKNDKKTLDSMELLLVKINKSHDNAMYPKSFDALRKNVQSAITNLSQRVGGF